jgi:hypothetical protein
MLITVTVMLGFLILCYVSEAFKLLIETDQNSPGDIFSNIFGILLVGGVYLTLTTCLYKLGLWDVWLK